MRERARQKIWCALAAGTLLTLVAQSSHADAIFSGVGTVDPSSSGNQSQAHGISANGLVVVGERRVWPNRYAFAESVFGRVNAPGFESKVPQQIPVAYDASANGSIVVGGSGHPYNPPGNAGNAEVAFRWTVGDSNLEMLGFLPGYDESWARGVSADGSVVVGFNGGYTDTLTEAFRWTSATDMVSLGDLPGGQYRSQAFDVSADGSKTVGWGYGATDIREAVLWIEGEEMTGLGGLSGGNGSSAARAISADGSFITGSASGSVGTEAHRWTEAGGMVGLGHLSGVTSGAYSWGESISDDGSVIVGHARDSSGAIVAMIWDEVLGMRDLQTVLETRGANLAGWTLEYATGISADGKTIVGWGTNPYGNEQGWIALVPEPGTGLLVGMGVLLLALRRSHC